MITFGAPFRYYQGQGAIDLLGEKLGPMGESFLLAADEIVTDIVGNRPANSLKKQGKKVYNVIFGGECCDREIQRLCEEYERLSCDAIVAIGGGKVADTVKAMSIKLNAPVAIVPTIASTDAPASHIALIYKEDHSKDRVVEMKFSPWCVLVDTDIILKSPVRFFAAGIGDAAATKFEADACYKSGASNFYNSGISRTAVALSDLCWDIIRNEGPEAYKSVKAKVHSQAFENVVEASILLSGLGFENGGLAAGHAISSGLSMISATQQVLHGESVSFGLIVQLVLEKRPQEYIEQMVVFLQQFGLTTNLASMGVTDAEDPMIKKMIKKICMPPNIIFNMPCEITTDILEVAIRRADAIGSKPGI